MTARGSLHTIATASPATAFVYRRGPALLYAVLIATALAFLYRSAAVFVWKAWLNDPYYTHGLVVFATALGLAGWRLVKTPATSEPPAWAPVTILAAGGVFVAGFVLHDPYLVVWSALALGISVALLTGGVARIRSLAMPFLLVATTLPTAWTLEVGSRLQLVAFGAATAILRATGVDLQQSVTTFSVGDLSFEVTAACSGFQSAVSLIALGAVIATVFRLPPRRRWAVLLAAAPVALVLNVGRILAVVAVGVNHGASAAEGFFHHWSSGLLFVAETIVLLAIAGVLLPRRKQREVTDG